MEVSRQEEAPKHRSKKDTKRWCKGRVGDEHDYQIHDEVNTVNSEFRPRRVWHQVWTRCKHCGKKGEYIGLFDDGEPWKLRRSKWIKEPERLRIQQMINEYVAQRNQGDATVCGNDSDTVSRKDRHWATGHRKAREST